MSTTNRADYEKWVAVLEDERGLGQTNTARNAAVQIKYTLSSAVRAGEVWACEGHLVCAKCTRVTSRGDTCEWCCKPSPELSQKLLLEKIKEDLRSQDFIVRHWAEKHLVQQAELSHWPHIHGTWRRPKAEGLIAAFQLDHPNAFISTVLEDEQWVSAVAVAISA